MHSIKYDSVIVSRIVNEIYGGVISAQIELAISSFNIHKEDGTNTN